VFLKHLLFTLVVRTSGPILFIPLILLGNPVSDTAGIIRHQRTFGLNHNHLPNTLNPGQRTGVSFLLEKQSPQINKMIFFIQHWFFMASSVATLLSSFRFHGNKLCVFSIKSMPRF